MNTRMLCLFMQVVLKQYDPHKDGAIDAVGAFLTELENSRTLQSCGLPSLALTTSEMRRPLLLHYASNFSHFDLIRLIIRIYEGLPQPYEILHCNHQTSEEEISLFMKRALKYPRQYMMLEVDKLTYRIQEVSY